jgi:ribosomal protein L36
MNAIETPNLVPFDDFLSKIQASRPTGHRYRKRGWITVINRAGRLYVTGTEIQRFYQRQASGEFSRKSPLLGRRKKEPV